jgi:plastocyanin
VRTRRAWGAAVVAVAAGLLIAGGAVAPAATESVSMEDDFFAPMKAKIGKGDRVTWTNEGNSDHTVKFEGEKNKVVNPGEQTGRKFKEEGKFNYRCTLHPGMTGKVIVR